MPSPTWPTPFLPQQEAADDALTAQVWVVPAVMAVALILPPPPDTVCAKLLLDTVPLPSCPELLKPQHTTALSAVKPQVWCPPAAIAVALVSPTTAVGRGRVTFVPSPSWPTKLLPQQRELPSARSAQV